MCGRTACTLDPQNICQACSYRQNNTGKYRVPDWRDTPGGQQYYPSHNVTPTSHTPVMVSRRHLDPEADPNERVIQPMMWGMIPKWHRGDYKSHGLSTINCRFESLMDKRLFKVPFNKGQRCVVVCDGFYEWQTKEKSSKQPYFLYFPQPKGIRIEEPSTWEEQDEELWSEDTGWKGPRLLTMAGIFDTWRSSEGEKAIYSYTIITVKSNPSFSWLHSRIPAILDHEEAIQDWLDYGKVSSSEACSLIKPTEDITWHPVSTAVGNSKFKDASCNKPISLEKPKLSSSAKLMDTWLKGSSKKDATESATGSEVKKVKQELKKEEEEEQKTSSEVKKVKQKLKKEEEEEQKTSSGMKTEKKPPKKKLKPDEEF